MRLDLAQHQAAAAAAAVAAAADDDDDDDAGSRRAGASSRNAYEAILCYEACTPALRRASKVLFRPRVRSTPADWRRSVVQQCFLSRTFAYEGILVPLSRADSVAFIDPSRSSDRRTGCKDECTV